MTYPSKYFHRTRKSLQGLTGYTILTASSCHKGVTTSTARPTKLSSRGTPEARNQLEEPVLNIKQSKVSIFLLISALVDGKQKQRNHELKISKFPIFVFFTMFKGLSHVSPVKWDEWTPDTITDHMPQRNMALAGQTTYTFAFLSLVKQPKLNFCFMTVWSRTRCF